MLKKGDKVRMTERFKKELKQRGCNDTVAEFGSCVGIVQGQFDAFGPEVDVRWQPSNLRYAYHPKDLVKINE